MGFPQISLTYPKKKMSSKEGDVIREDRNKMNFRDSQELLRPEALLAMQWAALLPGTGQEWSQPGEETETCSQLHHSRPLQPGLSSLPVDWEHWPENPCHVDSPSQQLRNTGVNSSQGHKMTKKQTKVAERLFYIAFQVAYYTVYWGQEEKGMTEDEMAGWHQWLDRRESEWTLGVGDGQGGLACCDSWGRKELDMTERLNWTELNWCICYAL